MPGPNTGLLEDQFLVASWFTLELPNATITNLTDISGLALEVNVAEAKQNTAGGKMLNLKLPGGAKYSEVTVKRKFTSDKSLWNLAKDIRDGKLAYRGAGAIVSYNLANTEVGRWTFDHCWLSKWSISDLDVGSDDVITEEATFQIEMLRRDS